ncbi:hypothetical protein AB4305_18675 [Nocardia sp. 2YAB30]|uniref:hypothetical protein n=1 Tax=unclassified Nocardia TaxID=2637762 RepID=UPI003F983110
MDVGVLAGEGEVAGPEGGQTGEGFGVQVCEDLRAESGAVFGGAAGGSVTNDQIEEESMVRLTPGTAYVVPRGRWHRIELDEPSDLMSIGVRDGSRRDPVATPTAR